MVGGISPYYIPSVSAQLDASTGIEIFRGDAMPGAGGLPSALACGHPECVTAGTASGRVRGRPSPKPVAASWASPRVILPDLHHHLAAFAEPDPGALAFPGAKGGPLR